MTVKISDNIVQIKLSNEYSLIYNKFVYKCVIIKDEFAKYLIDNKGSGIQINNYSKFEKLFESKVLLKDFIEPNHIVNLEQNIKMIKSRLPISIRFVPSYNCNEDCSYCIVSKQRQKNHNQFKAKWIDYAMKIIDKTESLSPVAPHNSANVTLIGGEPTLPENWIVCKKFLQEVNKKFNVVEHTLVTNGDLLNKTILDEFCELGGKHVYLSFDLRNISSKEGQPDNRIFFKKFLELCEFICSFNLQLLIDLKIGENTETFNNVLLIKLKNFSKNRNIKFICSPIVDEEEYNPLKKYKCDKMDIYFMKQKNILNKWCEIHDILRDKMVWPQMDEKSVFRCNVSNLSSLCFLPSGKVTTCGRLYVCDDKDIPILADVKERKYFEKVALEHIYMFTEDEECSKCDYAYLCGGKCLFARGGKCNYEKKGIEIMIDKCKNDLIEKVIHSQGD